MTSEQQKLTIIQKVIQCQDQQLLATLLRMLQALAPLPDEPVVSAAMISSILESPTTVTGEAVPQKDIDELQGAIDDIFGE